MNYKKKYRSIFALFALFASLLLGLAGGWGQAGTASADALWERLEVLERGPQGEPRSRAEAEEQVRNHLRAHLQLLDQFIQNHPRDPRLFSARLRQGALIASLATLDGDQQGLARAYQLLLQLESTRNLPRDLAADAAFQRISVLFLQARGREERMRENVVNASRNFAARYPGDRRGPRLLVEAATICDAVPQTKKELLEAALQATREETLRTRIIDDLRQIDLLGRPIAATVSLLEGGTISLAETHGTVTLLVFWSADSPQSLFWLAGFLQNVRALPPRDFRVIYWSVDADIASVRQAVEDLQIPGPVVFDAEGWDAPQLRRWGINAVPSVWVVDKQGRLRSTNGRQNYAEAIRRFARD
jgi:hypothetical protein